MTVGQIALNRDQSMAPTPAEAEGWLDLIVDELKKDELFRYYTRGDLNALLSGDLSKEKMRLLRILRRRVHQIASPTV